jgi:hypothetical protein
MTASEAESFDEVLRTETTRFLDTIDACVEALPDLLEAYGADGTVDARVEAIREAESDCDRAARRISSHIANADAAELGIRLTRVHLHAGNTIGLFQQLDEIPNTVEQIAEELEAIAPEPAPRVLVILREMATIASDAIIALRNAVIGYVDILCETDAQRSIAADVTEIRALESDVDRLRNDAITAAFQIEGRDALVYREIALLLDALVDTMEDVTDHMILTAGNRSWIDLEPADDDLQTRQ